ncbi:MAG: hypothetical protein M5U34_26300 [Chloroflexi bacterium]|nr:hypothetical protein [Chloroflexota bacterium]
MKLKHALYPFLVVIFSFVLWRWFIFQPLLLYSQETGEMGTRSATPPEADKLSALQAEIAAAEPGEMLRAIIYLAETGDSQQFGQNITDPALRHTALVAQLQTTAQQSQQSLLIDLAARQQAGSVQSYRPLWIINAVAVAATGDSLTQLAERLDVMRLVLDEARPLIQTPEPAETMEMMWQTAVLAAAAEEPWGIERVEAPHAWYGLGIDGAGVTRGHHGQRRRLAASRSAAQLSRQPGRRYHPQRQLV